MSEIIQDANVSMAKVQRLKTVGWLAATVAFVFLALLSLKFFFTTLSSKPTSITEILSGTVFYVTVSSISLIVAGIALRKSEKVKSAIAIAVAGLWLLPLGWVLLCIGVMFYFKPTRLKRVVFVVGGTLAVLIVLSMCVGALMCVEDFSDSKILSSVQCVFSFVMAVLQVILAACFASRKYLQIEDVILNYAGKIKDLLDRFLLNFLKAQYRESGYRVCVIYGCSVFVVGVICFAVLLFWASPGSISMGGYGKTEQLPWDQDLIVSAISQLIGCAIWGCFIFSQISCARKLRSHSIVSGSAPLHLLIARFLCVLFAVCVAVGVVYLFIGDPNEKSMTADWTLHLTLANISLLLSAARHCEPKTAITLSSIVTIWHLLGASFIIALVRDNIAKIQSMESTPDNKTDVA